jgi:predicted ATPase
MLNCYRRDFSALRNDIADIRSLTKDNRLPSLAATSQILEGWCEGVEGNAARGREMIRQGLEVHGELQTPEDYPVYCSLLAEIMTRTGEIKEGLELLAAAITAGEQTGHRYWLAELHRRRAHLLCLCRASDNEVLGAFQECLIIASEQNAVPILLTAFEALVSSGLSNELIERFGDRVERARSAVKRGEEVYANPEKILMRESVREP